MYIISFLLGRGFSISKDFITFLPFKMFIIDFFLFVFCLYVAAVPEEPVVEEPAPPGPGEYRINSLLCSFPFRCCCCCLFLWMLNRFVKVFLCFSRAHGHGAARCLGGRDNGRPRVGGYGTRRGLRPAAPQRGPGSYSSRRPPRPGGCSILKKNFCVLFFCF